MLVACLTVLILLTTAAAPPPDSTITFETGPIVDLLIRQLGEAGASKFVLQVLPAPTYLPSGEEETVIISDGE